MPTRQTGAPDGRFLDGRLGDGEEEPLNDTRDSQGPADLSEGGRRFGDYVMEARIKRPDGPFECFAVSREDDPRRLELRILRASVRADLASRFHELMAYHA